MFNVSILRDILCGVNQNPTQIFCSDFHFCVRITKLHVYNSQRTITCNIKYCKNTSNIAEGLYYKCSLSFQKKFNNFLFTYYSCYQMVDGMCNSKRCLCLPQTYIQCMGLTSRVNELT